MISFFQQKKFVYHIGDLLCRDSMYQMSLTFCMYAENSTMNIKKNPAFGIRVISARSHYFEPTDAQSVSFRRITEILLCKSLKYSIDVRVFRGGFK